MIFLNLATAQVLFSLSLIMMYLPVSIEQTLTAISPSPSIYLDINDSLGLENSTISSVYLNVSSINPNQTITSIMNSSAVIISQISGTTKTENYTFFLEFKTEALTWNADFLNERHNTFITKANEIVEVIDNLYSNDSTYKGSYVIGFREPGVYVSLKVQFKPGGDITHLDAIIEFLRNGGGDMQTDPVYLKLGKQADCIINYVDTTVCDCLSMTYKRQISCREPEINGGEQCPNACSTGHVIAGTSACSWDDLDEYHCDACNNKPLHLLFVLTVLGLHVIIL